MVLKGLKENVIPYYMKKGPLEAVDFLNKMAESTDKLIQNSYADENVKKGEEQFPKDFFSKDSPQLDHYFEGLSEWTLHNEKLNEYVKAMPEKEQKQLNDKIESMQPGLSKGFTLNFDQLSITPSQRGPRYELLLRDYEKTEEKMSSLIGSKENSFPDSRVILVKSKMDEINSKKGDIENRKSDGLAVDMAAKLSTSRLLPTTSKNVNLIKNLCNDVHFKGFSEKHTHLFNRLSSEQKTKIAEALNKEIAKIEKEGYVDANVLKMKSCVALLTNSWYEYRKK
jgi:hypothetical protein